MAKSTNKTESKTSFSFTGTCETSGREKPLKSNQARLEDVSMSAAWQNESSITHNSYVALVTMQKELATDSGYWCFIKRNKKLKKLHNTYIFVGDIC